MRTPQTKGKRKTRRVLPAIGLFFLAPLIGEALARELPHRFGPLDRSVPRGALRGTRGGALLIREVARRAGYGWPTIIAFALARRACSKRACDPIAVRPKRRGPLPFAHVRLQVFSEAFPRWNRNLGSGEPLVSATIMCEASQQVYHDPDPPSALTLPVNEST